MKYVIVGLLALVFFGCSEETESNSKTTIKEKPGKVTEVETLYEEGSFDNPVYVDLLKELDVCTDEKLCLQCATCTPEFFRFFEISKSLNVKDLFAIQIKALTKLKGENPLPTREVRVFVRDRGQLVLSNSMRGYIIKEITSESGVNDLVIRIRRFVQEEEHFFHCLFQWSEKDKKYLFKSVERIEGRTWGGNVKEEDKEETSQQVYSELLQEGFIR